MSPRPAPKEVSGPRPLRLHSVSQYELDAIVNGRPPARPTMDRRSAAPRQARPVSETALELAADLDDHRKEIGRSYVVAEVAMAPREGARKPSGDDRRRPRQPHLREPRPRETRTRDQGRRGAR